MTESTIQQKRCSTCEQQKALTEFCHNRTRPDGLNERCRDCAREAARKYYYSTKGRQNIKAYRSKPETKAMNAAIMRRYRQSEKGQAYNERQRKLQKRNQRKYYLKNRFNIEIERYEQMLAEQKGKCAICRKAPARSVLQVDHCHKSGRVRGLLCTHCNTGIGRLNDDPVIVQSALRYLQSHA